MIPVAIEFPVFVGAAGLVAAAGAVDEIVDTTVGVFELDLIPNPMAAKTMQTPIPKHGSLTQLPTLGISVVEILKTPTHKTDENQNYTYDPERYNEWRHMIPPLS